MLSSGLAVLFFLSPFAIVPALIGNRVPQALIYFAIAGCIVAGFSLCSHALLNYLFVWEASFRYGCLLLWEKPKKSSIRPTLTMGLPQNPAAPADG
jgi:hypothetical protein